MWDLWESDQQGTEEMCRRFQFLLELSKILRISCSRLYFWNDLCLARWEAFANRIKIGERGMFLQIWNK